MIKLIVLSSFTGRWNSLSGLICIVFLALIAAEPDFSSIPVAGGSQLLQPDSVKDDDKLDEASFYLPFIDLDKFNIDDMTSKTSFQPTGGSGINEEINRIDQAIEEIDRTISSQESNTPPELIDQDKKFQNEDTKNEGGESTPKEETTTPSEAPSPATSAEQASTQTESTTAASTESTTTTVHLQQALDIHGSEETPEKEEDGRAEDLGEATEASSTLPSSTTETVTSPPTTAPPVTTTAQEEEDKTTDSDEKTTESPKQESTEAVEDTTAEASGTEKELLRKFKLEEDMYHKHPFTLELSRRMFDHIPEEREAKIASMARFIDFMDKNSMKGKMTDREDVCSIKSIKCNKNDKYRTMDGTCNNLENPTLGSTFTPLVRLLPPAYGDKKSLPRGVSSYSPETGYVSNLPPPRLICDVVFDEGQESETDSKTTSHMLMEWGQFVDHDITATSKDPVDCCHPEIKKMSRCFNIEIPDNDSFYSQFGRKCLDFTRSNQHCDPKLKVIEQFNKRTSFIDGSPIYGTNEKFALLLRGDEERQRGKLKQNSQLPNFLPSKFDLKIRDSPHDKSTDFVAGDDRLETQASLTSIHNLFMNEHNGIAEELFKALEPRAAGKPDVDLDQLVYQETRKIVAAEVQSITYNEYLPQVFGKKRYADLNLFPTLAKYDPKVDPSIINSFATAAYRFGHSLVQSIFKGENQPWRLGKFFGDSRFARLDNGRGYINELLGLSKQPCQQTDIHISKQLTTHLFSNNVTKEGDGHDLGSTNIQRGRDHGIPSYNSFRKECGLKELKSLDSKPDDIGEEAWSKIKQVYKNVEDIDLYVGGLSEKIIDGVVGPTFGCIIGKQFKNLMNGDRFFYHHKSGPNIRPLKGSALSQIQNRKLSDIICDRTDIPELPDSVFTLPKDNNKPKPCSSHNKLDIQAIAKEIEV